MRAALTELLSKAGSIIERTGPSAFRAKEGRSNYVSDTDLKVQEYLRQGLSALLPGSLFFSEEQLNAPLTGEPTWVVDPLDGTMNYLRQRHCSSISVALLEGRKPVTAAVFNPYSGEMFFAQAGCGSCLNGQPVRVSELPIENALVSFGTSPYREDLAAAGMALAGRFLLRASDLRRTGSAAIDLTDVACGRSEVFFELLLSPWDYAAGALLVTEAGGCFEMPFEPQADFGKPACVLACNGACREEALRIMKTAPGLSSPHGCCP